MSTRDQLVKRTSDLSPTGVLGGDKVEVKEVWNVQFTSAPNHGDVFAVGPLAYRMVSAGTTGFDTNFMSVAYNTDVSTAASAFSAAVNLATSIDGFNNIQTNIGATALTKAASTTDITVTAALAGNSLGNSQIGGQTVLDNTAAVSGVQFTQTTANVGGHRLPEGYQSYQTSAGNTVVARDPAEMTRLQRQFPPKRP